LNTGFVSADASITMEFFVKKQDVNTLIPQELLLPGLILLMIIIAAGIAVKR